MADRPVAAPPVTVRPMTADDLEAVVAIHAEGVDTGNATLDHDPPSATGWDAGHRADCRFVAVVGERVVGWTALSQYSRRAVYAGVAWESVYVTADSRGQGVGSALLAAIVPASEQAGVWTLFAGVIAENTASLALHERAGFRRVGMNERLGRDGTGRWRDVVLLERRSEVAGRD